MRLTQGEQVAGEKDVRMEPLISSCENGARAKQYTANAAVSAKTTAAAMAWKTRGGGRSSSVAARAAQRSTRSPPSRARPSAPTTTAAPVKDHSRTAADHQGM